MSFSYNPMSEAECEQKRQFPLLEPGEYDFKVSKSTFKESKSNNPMIELVLEVWDKQGKPFIVYDYLIGTENMEWKTRHFCKAVGLQKTYEEKKFNEYMATEKCGKVLIAIQEGKKNPNGGTYKTKNIVEDYIEIKQGEKKSELGAQFIDSDLPF